MIKYSNQACVWCVWKQKIFFKMFSMDAFDFESVMSKHLFDGHQIHATGSTSSGSDFFLCDEYSSDSDVYSGFNSDQENNEEKM